MTATRLLPRLLVVEDDPPQAQALLHLFSGEYDAVAASNVAGGLELADRFAPELALVDLGLPDLDGIELVRHLRVRGTAVLVITADHSEDRIVAALDMGATDYVTKPFSAPVLRARVRNSLRYAMAERERAAAEVIRVGDVVIDLAAYQAVAAGVALDLQPRQIALLALLARQAGRVVTHTAISQHLWAPHDTATKANLASIRMAVTRLRAALGTGPARPVIETEARVGYRLVVPKPAADRAD